VGDTGAGDERSAQRPHRSPQAEAGSCFFGTRCPDDNSQHAAFYAHSLSASSSSDHARGATG